MSHLAPGGYYLLFFLVVPFSALWLVMPGPVEHLMGNIKDANAAVITVLFTVFVVLCYFTGVVIRLPSVDNVDDASVEYALNKELVSKKQRSFLRDAFTRMTPWMRPRIDHRFQDAAKDVFELLGPKTAAPLLRHTQTEFAIDDLRTLIRRVAQNHIRFSDSQGLQFTPPQSPELKEFLMKWLWVVDRFPYPTWFTFTAYLHAPLPRREEFSKHQWVILCEALGGNSYRRELSQAAFNRCKLAIRKNSEALAAEIDDREAITRMMAGFYWGTRLWSIGSLVALAVLSGMVLLGEFVSIPHSTTYLCAAYLFYLTSLIFNSAMLQKVVCDFHILRVRESESVLDSYLLVVSKP